MGGLGLQLGWIERHFSGSVLHGERDDTTGDTHRPVAGRIFQPGATVTTLTPTLTWNASSGATAYSVSVSKVGGGTVLAQNVSTNSITCPTLVNGGTYLWAVSASSSAGSSATSAVVYFTVNVTTLPATPTGLSPGGSSQPGATVTTLTPTLTWNASPGATAYSVAVSQVGGGTVLAQNVSTNSITCPTLVNGGTYFVGGLGLQLGWIERHFSGGVFHSQGGSYHYERLTQSGPRF